MKDQIKALPGFKLAKRFRNALFNNTGVIRSYIYDYRRFKKYYTSETKKEIDVESLTAWILQDKHRLEKGISLPSPRESFGEIVIKRLVANTLKYANTFGKDDIYFIALGSLKAYQQFHIENGLQVKPSILQLIESLPEDDFKHERTNDVGLNQPYETPNTSEYFTSFIDTRKSCRNFDTTKSIPDSVIEEVIKLSIRTPSVCNRQHWKVHIYSGKKAKHLLELQNGNQGFTENIPYVAVLTSDLRAFYMAYERTQAFTDGGMFAMSFIYALHAYGISSCPLNWCVAPDYNEALYKRSGIPKSESCIMFVAFGYGANDCRRAKSPRLDVSNFYTIDNNE
jgi:nitroreductase